MRSTSASRVARGWFALTALAVAAGVVIQVAVAADTPGRFTTPAGRALNVFCFFTVQSNLLVGLACLLLARRPDRRSIAFRVLRLTSLVAITITAVVYHLVLAGLREVTHWALAADVLLHTVVPLLAVVGWLVLGPRGLTARRVAAWSIVFPLAWLAFTLVRGAIDGFYPYPFVDVSDLGYGRVALNCVIIAALYVGVAFGAAALDRRLPGRAPPASGR